MGAVSLAAGRGTLSTRITPAGPAGTLRHAITAPSGGTETLCPRATPGTAPIGDSETLRHGITPATAPIGDDETLRHGITVPSGGSATHRPHPAVGSLRR
jgi:hypothetical protein